MNKYNLVDTIDKLKALDEILMKGQEPRYNMLAYDTETNGLHIKLNTVVGFSVSFNKECGFYIPFLKWVRDEDSKRNRTIQKVKYEIYEKGHLECVWTGKKFDEFITAKDYDVHNTMPLIHELMIRWFSKTNLIMHNAPFDVNMTHAFCGLDLKNNVAVDTALLAHILDENEPSALKKVIERDYVKSHLGINPYVEAATEKKELDENILISGGKKGHVWRAELPVQSKYACADTFYTYGVFEACFSKFQKEFGNEGVKWFLEDEVMPVCKEVVIDMKRRGVFIDAPYFEKMLKETQNKLYELEDKVHEMLNANNLLEGFNVGKSIDQTVTDKALIKHILELEGRQLPTKINSKGEVKETTAKDEIGKMYEEDPHWTWGYMLGQDEIKYKASKIEKIKKEVFIKSLNKKDDLDKLKPVKRYRFNINSDAHLRWLFCEKLGMDPAKLPQTDTATKDKVIPSMAASVLKEFMYDQYDFVPTLMSYKKLVKMESTYIRPAVLLNVDGWLHMDMKQNGTTSGRFSCSGGYNLQTLPRVDDEMDALESCEKCDSENVEVIQDIEIIADLKCKDCGHVNVDIPRPSAIKKGFVAPEGYKIVNADYSSLEPRCFAFMSGQQSLKDVYLKGLDLYSQVYCEILDDKGEYSADPKAPNFLKKVAKSKRSFIKPVVLGIPYGAEAAQVANLLGLQKEYTDRKTGEVRKFLDVEKGQEFIDKYLGKLTDLKRFMDDQDLKAVTQGYVETIVGRRRHLKNAKVIKEVLDKYGIDYLDLKSAPRKDLKLPDSNVKSKTTGIQINFPKEALYEIAEILKIKKITLSEKDNWALIKYLLKNDLNNSKNNPIQGLAGHITNKGMLDANRNFRKQNLDALVILNIHDEIACYAKVEDSEKTVDLLRTAMEDNIYAKMVDIPMVAEPCIADSFKEAK